MNQLPGTAHRIRKVDALTVAMALVPGVYARNRMFDFFKKEGVQRAKSRASTLLGIVRHLGQARALTISIDDAVARPDPRFVLRYVIPDMRLSRVVELTRLELATLRLLAHRAGASCLPLEDSDRALVDMALAQLIVSGDESEGLARAAKSVSIPPAPLEPAS